MNIITAIGNPILNERLKEKKDLKIIGKDIQYQEGVIEVLEERQDIDILIISNMLPEEYEFTKWINKIKNINKDVEIIVFLESPNENIEKFLNSKNIYKIYYLDMHNIDYFINNFYKNNSDFMVGITREINSFKKIILENKNDNLLNKINEKNQIKNLNSNSPSLVISRNIEDNNYEKINEINYNNFYSEENCKVIAISGVSGVRKKCCF